MQTGGSIMRTTGWTRVRRGGAAIGLAAAGAAILAGQGCTGEGDRRALDATSGQVMTFYREDAAAKPGPGGGAKDRFARLAEKQKAYAAPPAGAAPAPGAVPPPKPPAPPGFISPLTPAGEHVPVTLQDCLRRALAHNVGIQIARFGPEIARTSVLEAEAMFDPSWFMNNAVSRVRADAGTLLAGAATLIADQWDFSTGIQGLLPTGGTVSLAQDWVYIDSNSAFYMPNPQVATGLALALAQPLLRGAGPTVTRSPIVLARLDHRISLADFRRQVMDTLLEVETTYWQLVLAQRRVAALGESLEAARENRRVAQARLAEGKATRHIVSLASSAVTERQASLIAARLQQAETSDRLKRLLGAPDLRLDDPTLLEATELPLADPVPVDRAMLQATLVAALRNRPELHQAEARLRQTDLQERVARNDRLPRLDLAASYALTGLDGRARRALDEQFGADFYEWSVGLELEVPIGNRARRAAHLRSQLERNVAVKQREDTEQRVLLEVSDAVRNLAAAEESVLATRAAREAAEQTLADQQVNVGAGSALVKDLLDAQRDLADAKVREIEAMVNYMTGLAAVERAKGTLLDYNGIRVLEPEKRPAPKTP